MPIQKEHKEFYTVDMGQGWEVPMGYPSGIEQQILDWFVIDLGARRHAAFAVPIAIAASSTDRPWQDEKAARRTRAGLEIIILLAITRVAAAQNHGELLGNVIFGLPEDRIALGLLGIIGVEQGA